MAKFDKETIAKLSKLCRINLSESEQKALQKDLKEILDYVDQLNDIDTENVEPCNHVLADMVNVMREDVVGTSLPRELFMGNVPSQAGGLVRVPPVIKAQP